MANFGLCLSICLFTLSALNFKFYLTNNDIKHGLLSLALIAAAFHCLKMVHELDKEKEEKKS